MKHSDSFLGLTVRLYTTVKCTLQYEYLVFTTKNYFHVLLADFIELIILIELIVWSFQFLSNISLFRRNLCIVTN